MTAAGEARAERAARRPASSPRAVTRGEEKQAAQVDWLNASFPKPELSLAGLVALLGRMFGRPISALAGGGFLGFDHSVKLFAHHGADQSAIGFIAHGGEAQGGRWLLSLSGVGCSFVPHWGDMAELLESLEARITRLDLAVDFLNGEYTVDEAVMWSELGGYAFDGRTAPKTRIDGDWLDGKDGRTFYVGKAQNGKMLRCYEKGKQLGDESSEWVRFEVQLGNRDRVIPFEALTDRDAFFAGCYPCLQTLVERAAEFITTSRAKGETNLGHLVFHLRRSYGRLVDVLSKHVGATNTDLVECVRVIGLPRRLDYSSAVAGVEWASVKARVQRKEAA